MDTLKLNETISCYRKKQGLTQEALAQVLGVTNQSVSKWESGQCCPDIGLIPQLADVFGVTIDELFGKEPQMTNSHRMLPNEIDLENDDTIRVVVAQGKRILQADEWDKPIEIRFPVNCNETTRQYFKVEVFGNLHCDASINGDVIGHGMIECHDINGDIRECRQDAHCQGDISGDIHGCCGNVSCDGDINGDIYGCAGNISCGGDWNGDRYDDQ